MPFGAVSLDMKPLMKGKRLPINSSGDQLYPRKLTVQRIR